VFPQGFSLSMVFRTPRCRALRPLKETALTRTAVARCSCITDDLGRSHAALQNQTLSSDKPEASRPFEATTKRWPGAWAQAASPGNQ
jgi:hypothetical protein